MLDPTDLPSDVLDHIFERLDTGDDKLSFALALNDPVRAKCVFDDWARTTPYTYSYTAVLSHLPQDRREWNFVAEIIRFLFVKAPSPTRLDDVLPHHILRRTLDYVLTTDDIRFVMTFADAADRLGGVLSLLLERNVITVGSGHTHDDAVHKKSLAILSHILFVSCDPPIPGGTLSLRALRFLVATRRLVLGPPETWATRFPKSRAVDREDAQRFGQGVVVCLRNGNGDLLNQMVEKGYVDFAQIRDMLLSDCSFDSWMWAFDAHPGLESMKQPGDLFQVTAFVSAERWQPQTLELAFECGARPDPEMLVAATLPSRHYRNPTYDAVDALQAARDRGGMENGKRVVLMLTERYGIGRDAWRAVAERNMIHNGLEDLILW